MRSKDKHFDPRAQDWHQNWTGWEEWHEHLRRNGLLPPQGPAPVSSNAVETAFHPHLITPSNAKPASGAVARATLSRTSLAAVIATSLRSRDRATHRRFSFVRLPASQEARPDALRGNVATFTYPLVTLGDWVDFDSATNDQGPAAACACGSAASSLGVVCRRSGDDPAMPVLVSLHRGVMEPKSS